MSDSPKETLFQRLFSGPASAILAAVVGGVFSLIAAVAPYFISAFSPSSNSGNPPAPSPAVTSASILGSTEAPRGAQPRKPHLTYGTWTLLESLDDEGTNWSNSVLKFTKQTPTEDGLELEGFFEWRNGHQLIGREYVRGNYVEDTRNIYIEGERVECPEGTLAVGSFSARLAEDNRHLNDGTWGSEVGQQSGVPGTWRARR